MRMPAAARPALLLLGLLLAAACASGGAPASSGGAAGVAPPMVIEAFLRATNQQDLDTMASLFGTADGPVTRTWTEKEIDDRMLIFSTLLRHTDYNIGPEQIVAGRRRDAAQYTVRLVIERQPYEVPFTLVRAGSNTWLIENIEIERVTRGRVEGS